MKKELCKICEKLQQQYSAGVDINFEGVGADGTMQGFKASLLFCPTCGTGLIPKEPTKRQKKESEKNSYGEFRNVKLTTEEREKLILKFGYGDATKAIETLGAYMRSKNRRYADHYATLLNWVKRFDTTVNTKKEIQSPSASYTNEQINKMFDDLKSEDI